MKNRMIARLALALLLTSSHLSADGRVSVDARSGDIEITTDEAIALAGEVVDSSLHGVGRMLGAMRGRDPGAGARRKFNVDDVKVRFDPARERYIVEAGEGTTITFDAETGRYTVDAEDAAAVAGALIEESLAAVGSMVRGLRSLRSPGPGVPTADGLLPAATGTASSCCIGGSTRKMMPSSSVTAVRW